MFRFEYRARSHLKGENLASYACRANPPLCDCSHFNLQGCEYLDVNRKMDPKQRDKLFPSAKVFCNPEFLRVLQNSPHRAFTDSKTLVDLHLKLDPDEVLDLFKSLPDNPSAEEYNSFMNQVFETEYSLTRSVVKRALPKDFNRELPTYVQKLQKPSKQLIAFVSDLKERWKDLCREFVDDVGSGHSASSSLIHLPYPFFVPGGRFRECYYWDTLWIVKGLVVCDMIESAKDALRNLFYLIERIGFVPNGNRVYYLNRSQPPLLTEAVKIVYDAIDDESEQIEWLQEAVPVLDEEYAWFCQNRSVRSQHPDGPFSSRSLSMYCVDTVHPRPESFKEDTRSFERRRQTALWPNEEISSTSLYRNLASAAESGWDFSSRWFAGPVARDLESTQICGIIPVCLNSILLKVEKTLASFHQKLADHMHISLEQVETANGSTLSTKISSNTHTQSAITYQDLAKARERDMRELLWNDDIHFWFDYDLETRSCSSVVSSAGIMPVWAGCADDTWVLSDAKRFVDFVMNSDLMQPGGLACTTQTSEEQWDFPNAWPPLIDLAVEALHRLERRFPSSGAAEAAKLIARGFLENAWSGWSKDKNMYEKYDSTVTSGERGKGGEYAPQTGFGWTNGAVLWLLRDYGNVMGPQGSEQQ